MMNNNLTANLMQILDIIQHIVQIRKLIRFYYAFRQNGGSDHENWRGPVTYYSYFLNELTFFLFMSQSTVWG